MRSHELLLRQESQLRSPAGYCCWSQWGSPVPFTTSTHHNSDPSKVRPRNPAFPKTGKESNRTGCKFECKDRRRAASNRWCRGQGDERNLGRAVETNRRVDDAEVAIGIHRRGAHPV